MKLRAVVAMALAFVICGLKAGPPIQGATDPVAATQAIYDKLMRSPDDLPPTSVPYSRRLHRLLARDSAGGEIGCLDFDFFIDGQDGAVSAAHVALVGKPLTAKAVVDVRFTSSGRKNENQFIWIKEGKSPLWVIDDVIGVRTPTGPFRLSTLLTKCH